MIATRPRDLFEMEVDDLPEVDIIEGLQSSLVQEFNCMMEESDDDKIESLHNTSESEDEDETLYKFNFD